MDSSRKIVELCASNTVSQKHGAQGQRGHLFHVNMGDGRDEQIWHI